MSLINRYESLRHAAELAVEGSQDFSPLVDQILTGVVLDVLGKYQQKIVVGIEDSFGDNLNDFKLRVTETIFNAAGRWKIVDHEPFLFPKDCRFCYQRGNSIVAVIEQNPQVRTLNLSQLIVGEAGVADRDQNDRNVRLPLAMPYTIFVMHFRNIVEDAAGRSRLALSGIYHGWRTAPLKGLDDTLFLPFLPNIHGNLNVCMGHTRSPSGETISEQVEGSLTYFWNSNFNKDLAQWWWQKENFSPKLKNAHVWSKNSLIDSMFILNSDILAPAGKTVRDMIDFVTMSETQPDESQLRHNLSESIDGCIAGFSRGMDRYLKKTKFEKFFPKDVKDLAAGVIKEVECCTLLGSRN